MKVEIQQNEKEKSKDVFPHLGIYEDGEICLFTSKRENGLCIGICLYQGDSDNFLGEYSETWHSEYKLFTGKITLSND